MAPQDTRRRKQPWMMRAKVHCNDGVVRPRRCSRLCVRRRQPRPPVPRLPRRMRSRHHAGRSREPHADQPQAEIPHLRRRQAARGAHAAVSAGRRFACSSSPATGSGPTTSWRPSARACTSTIVACSWSPIARRWQAPTSSRILGGMHEGRRTRSSRRAAVDRHFSRVYRALAARRRASSAGRERQRAFSSLTPRPGAHDRGRGGSEKNGVMAHHEEWHGIAGRDDGEVTATADIASIRPTRPPIRVAVPKYLLLRLLLLRRFAGASCALCPALVLRTEPATVSAIRLRSVARQAPPVPAVTGGPLLAQMVDRT